HPRQWRRSGLREQKHACWRSLRRAAPGALATSIPSPPFLEAICGKVRETPMTAAWTTCPAPLPTAIIGAGSSGLTVLKALKEAGLPAVCFERGSKVGGNWVFDNDNGQSRIYRSLRINTSRDRMQFSDFPMPADYPDYAGHEQVARYFEAYAEAFGLRASIRFRSTVERVTLSRGDRWGPDP